MGTRMHTFPMDEQLPPPPTNREQWQMQSRLRKSIYIALLVGGAWVFPPVLLFYIGYYIYLRRKGQW